MIDNFTKIVTWKDKRYKVYLYSVKRICNNKNVSIYEKKYFRWRCVFTTQVDLHIPIVCREGSYINDVSAVIQIAFKKYQRELDKLQKEEKEIQDLREWDGVIK